MATEAFYWLAIPVLFIGLLALGAVVGEVLLPRWSRRLRRLEAGRRRQAQDWQETLDRERREAARWLSQNCFWKGEL